MCSLCLHFIKRIEINYIVWVTVNLHLALLAGLAETVLEDKKFNPWKVFAFIDLET